MWPLLLSTPELVFDGLAIAAAVASPLLGRHASGCVGCIERVRGKLARKQLHRGMQRLMYQNKYSRATMVTTPGTSCLLYYLYTALLRYCLIALLPYCLTSLHTLMTPLLCPAGHQCWNDVRVQFCNYTRTHYRVTALRPCSFTKALVQLPPSLPPSSPTWLVILHLLIRQQSRR